ncbi:MAG: AraC family transcriptional regulator [Polyangiales bacterium]
MCQTSLTLNQPAKSPNDPKRLHASIPAVHGLHLIELMQEWAIEPKRLLADLDLDLAELNEPDAMLTIPVAERLMARARALSGEDGLGIYMGMKMRASAHGHLGLAAMMSCTVRQGLDLAARFAPTRTDALTLRVETDAETARLVILENESMGSIREDILFALILGIVQIGEMLTGRPLEGTAHVMFDEPSYIRRFDHITRNRLRFSQPRNELRFDATYLDLPLSMADPVAQQLALKECERQLQVARERNNIVHRVRAYVRNKEKFGANLGDVAGALGTSERTLKRRLSEQGTTFSIIKDECRHALAMTWLSDSAMSVDQIALRLGYSDTANFTRAFRRWEGRPPTSVRK